MLMRSTKAIGHCLKGALAQPDAVKKIWYNLDMKLYLSELKFPHFAKVISNIFHCQLEGGGKTHRDDNKAASNLEISGIKR